MLQIMELMDTLLPEPVDPATRRWGILAKSMTKGSPEISFPSARISFDSDVLKASESTISFR